jgi:heptose I phosphotransferase
MMWLHDDLQACLAEADKFERLMTMQGEVFRHMPKEGRITLRFDCGGDSYFIKIHNGVGWREIFKNLFNLRKPILGARNEWQAIQKLDSLGIPTTPLAGYGERGVNPATKQSFVVTRDLGKTISLEDLVKDWRDTPPAPAFKRALIRQTARIGRTLHGNGMNHRDFYLCHFLLDQHEAINVDNPLLYLIDLHRVQLRTATPRRWIVKDIGGLYFSALDAGLTRRDVFRFLKAYFQQPLRQILHNEQALLDAFTQRAIKNYRIMHDRDPVLP